MWLGRRSLLSGLPDAESNWFWSEFPDVEDSDKAERIPWFDEDEGDMLKLSRLD